MIMCLQTSSHKKLKACFTSTTYNYTIKKILYTYTHADTNTHTEVVCAPPNPKTLCTPQRSVIPFLYNNVAYSSKKLKLIINKCVSA